MGSSTGHSPEIRQDGFDEFLNAFIEIEMKMEFPADS